MKPLIGLVTLAAGISALTTVSAHNGVDHAREKIDGALWIGNVGGKAAKRIRAACAAAAAHVREGLASGDKGRINAKSEHGWTMFDAAWTSEFTPAQRGRIAAMNEHGEGQGGHGEHERGMPHSH